MATLLQSCKYIRNIIGILGHPYRRPPIRNCGALLNVYQNDFGPAKFYSTQFDAHRSIKSLTAALQYLDEVFYKTRHYSRTDVDTMLRYIETTADLKSEQIIAAINCFGEALSEEMPEVRTKLVQDLWQTFKSLNVPFDISHYNALLGVYVENGYDFAPEDILREIEANGLVPNRTTFLFIIQKYCQAGDMESAGRILQYMKEKDITISANIFNALILGYGNIGEMDAANSIPDLMKASNIEPNRETYRNLLLNKCKTGDIDAISAALQRYKSEKVALYDQDVLKIIFELSIHGHAAKVGALFEYLLYSNAYNNSAYNVVLQLVNSGHDEVAFNLLKTMRRQILPNGKTGDAGRFFLRQLVKLNRPTDAILAYCEQMLESGLSRQPYDALLNVMSANNQSIDAQLDILRKLQSAGNVIADNQFKFLFRNAQTSEETKRLLKALSNEFKIPLSSKFICDYVIESLRCSRPQDTLNALRAANVSMRICATAVVHSCLRKNDLKTAAEIATKYNLPFTPGTIQSVLTSALLASNDIDSYADFIVNFYENATRNKSNDPFPADRNDMLGQIVCNSLLALARQSRHEMMVQILTVLVDRRLAISAAQEERIRITLDSNVTEEMAHLLAKLSAGELSFVSTKTQRQTDWSLSTTEMEELATESTDEEIKAKYQSQLLLKHARNKDADSFEKSIQKMLSEGVVFGDGLLATWLKLYIETNDANKAFETYKKIREISPNFTINRDNLIANYVETLCNDNKIDEALQFLNDNRPESTVSKEDGNKTAIVTYINLVNRLRGKVDPDRLTKLAEYLMENNYVDVSQAAQPDQKKFFGNLIRAHLEHNNTARAVEQFEKIVKEYDCVALRNELMCRLIQDGDSEKQERVIKAMGNRLNKNKCHHSLIYSLIDCGKMSEARNTLQNRVSSLNILELGQLCSGFERRGRTECLERLLNLTEDDGRFDNRCVWLSLLCAYCKDSTPKRALDLWERVQEAGHAPTDEFMNQLASFLKQLGQPVPFHESALQKTGPRKASAQKGMPAATDSTALNGRELLRMINDKADAEAKAFLFENLGNISLKPLAAYLIYLVNNGDYQTLKELKLKQSKYMNEKTHLAQRLVQAYYTAGKIETMIDELQAEIENGSGGLNNLTQLFPVSQYMTVLKAHPNLLPKLEKLSEAYAAKGDPRYINHLWCYHLLQGNDEACEAIWERSMAALGKILFRTVIDDCRASSNVVVMKKLIQYLKTNSKLSQKTLGVAYTALLNIYIVTGRVEESLSTIQELSDANALDTVDRNALKSIKNNLEAAGKAFPFEVPVAIESIVKAQPMQG